PLVFARNGNSVGDRINPVPNTFSHALRRSTAATWSRPSPHRRQSATNHRVVTWPIIFMLVILKIPIIYLCAVIWWAIKSEKRPEQPAALIPAWDPELGGPSWRRGRRGRPGPRSEERRV